MNPGTGGKTSSGEWADVVLVSHSMEDVVNYAEAPGVMDDGHVAFDGTPAHHKELEKMGLSAPQVTWVAHALRKKRMGNQPGCLLPCRKCGMQSRHV